MVALHRVRFRSIPAKTWLHDCQDALSKGEIGIQGPSKVTSTGLDFITYDPIFKKINVWDAKYSSSGRFPSGLPASKLGSWNSQISDAVQSYTGPYADQILTALQNGALRARIFPYGRV